MREYTVKLYNVFLSLCEQVVGIKHKVVCLLYKICIMLIVVYVL